MKIKIIFKGRWYAMGINSKEFRMTKPREVVLAVLRSRKGHLTADEIFEVAKELYPSIGFASVYRSLRLFEKYGIVEVVSFGNRRKKHYQLKNRRTKVKIHLVCTNCAKIKDFSERNKEVKRFLKEISETLYNKYKFKLSSVDMQIFGECEECKK
ncbi:MAG: transcriptional repressor [Caldisericaceae bacterium]|nr:transcriptional repressor [Caldisericaceae bacterium]